jgi:hypothetical protein
MVKRRRQNPGDVGEELISRFPNGFHVDDDVLELIDVYVLALRHELPTAEGARQTVRAAIGILRMVQSRLRILNQVHASRVLGRQRRVRQVKRSRRRVK